MNRYKKLVKTLCILVIFMTIGCDQDTPFSDNNPKSGYVALESENLLIEESGTLKLPVNLNTSINPNGVEVSYTIEVISGTLPTNFNDNTNGRILIEAGEIRSEINLTIAENNTEYAFKVKLTGVNDLDFTIGISDGSKITSTDVLVRACSIPQDYLVGQYILTSPLANIWCSAPQPSFIGDGVQVEVSIGDSPNQRVFGAKYAPGSCEGFNGPYQFVIELACGQVFLSNTVTTGVSCNGGATQIAIVDDPNRVGNYDINNDNEITVNVIDDVNASCSAIGAPFANQSFTLTRL